MFEFTASRKRMRVQALLTQRINANCLDEICGNDRGPARSPFVTALAVIPGSPKSWQFDEAFPALSRDISTQGMALVHHSPLSGMLLVEVPGEDEASSFVRCSVQHCSDLGYGHWHIGLKVEEVVAVKPFEADRLAERMSAFADTCVEEG